MLANELPIGTPVFIWARPAEDLILLMGDGTYDGMTHINGQSFPVVKLIDGREVTVHFAGVYMGEKGAVTRTCASFKGKGDILDWDIELYLSGKRPTREQRAVSGVVGTNDNPANAAPPKTFSDQVLLLKRQIDYEKAKVQAAETAIATSNKLIMEKRAKIAALRDSVMAEFSELDGIPEATILAAAERIKAEQVKTVNSSEPMQPNGVAPTVDEHHRMATED